MLLYATMKVTIKCLLINKVHLDEAKNEFNNINGSQTMDSAKNAYQLNQIKKNELKKKLTQTLKKVIGRRQTYVLEHQDLSLLGKEMVVGPQINFKMK